MSTGALAGALAHFAEPASPECQEPLEVNIIVSLIICGTPYPPNNPDYVYFECLFMPLRHRAARAWPPRSGPSLAVIPPRGWAGPPLPARADVCRQAMARNPRHPLGRKRPPRQGAFAMRDDSILVISPFCLWWPSHAGCWHFSGISFRPRAAEMKSL